MFRFTSFKAKIIPSALESGLSMKEALYLINKYFINAEKELSTITFVIYVVKRISPYVNGCKIGNKEATIYIGLG